MKRITLILLLTGLVSANAWADHHKAAEKPYIYASQSAQMNAVVEAINMETREVTLRGPQGNAVSMVVGEEARNLDQVEVGDIVSAEYVRSLSIEVLPGDGSEPGAGGLTAAARAEKGEMPAGVVMDTQVVTATVEAIDMEANTFKLKFPDGAVEQFTARDPKNLALAEVGDLVVITTTEALALRVDHASGE
ncbi:MAG: hypothetical protein ACO3KY_01865 [Lysobacterales bacterium]|jgi:hypothetical protein